MMKARLTKIFRVLGGAALLFAAWGACVRAESKPAPLSEYRERVRKARAPLEGLAALCEKIAEGERYENWSKPGWDKDLPLTFPGAEERALRDVRDLMPVTEQVEWGGAVVRADNTWLRDALRNYERDSARGGVTHVRRAEMLGEIAERLRALEVRLDESGQSAAAQAQRDKDAEKGRLANILSRPEYNKQAAEGGALQRLVEQFFQWLRDLFPDLAPVRPGASPGVSRAAQIFVIALCLAVLAYVARKYWLRRERGSKAERLPGPRVVLGEHLEADQTAADLLSDAERLARTGDLRGAIRKAYIALLCELGDRRVIRLAQHKTNRDYLQAIRAAAPPRLYTEMLPLTFNFELHWYGLQAAEESDWKDFHQRCRQVLRSI
jgi:hypothetical protein